MTDDSRRVYVDTSALIALAFSEEESAAFEALIVANGCRVGAPTLVEVHNVLVGKLGEASGLAAMDRLTTTLDIEVVPFDESHFLLAASAFRRFGKGRDHPARLNFGDCLAYAVAKGAGAPLLYKGDDFGHTDLA
ncbi:type II toxin-antitoxin system VapC family toxin [Salinarimonas ramus]|uniref:Ribonuclease VapC n=1 Tax=Salinarimonas ramus TaxID=690164 RepID=A0A917Q6J2_9HYPH|nr:type II toxin-antitoxin system VapC family toxin [Salinarimonas ramus]GGK32038.1 ribonuclease VapC [Salinarimonas ramus]